MSKVEQPKSKKQRISHDNDTYLWHFRLGHINPDRIKKLVKDSSLRKLNVDTLPVYKSFLKGKMTKRSFFSGKANWPKNPLS